MGGYPYPLLEEIGDRRTGEDAYEEERKASRSPPDPDVMFSADA
jgi:hypothetical protein